MPCPCDAESKEARRVHLVRLMGKNGLSCADVARMLDRSPNLVRKWRAGYQQHEVTDHALALLELLIKHGHCSDRPEVAQCE